MPFFMAGDQHISVAVQCVEVAHVAISIFFSGEQAEQWEVGYIFPATELLSLSSCSCLSSAFRLSRLGIANITSAVYSTSLPGPPSLTR